MVLCNEKCLPCCDYCIYAMTERIPYNGKMIKVNSILENKKKENLNKRFS